MRRAKIELKILGQLLNLIQKRLPKRGKILCLSLTGSRAFGWGEEEFDYDIHGIFLAKDYWDWVHLGTRGGFDINLYELEYLFTHLPDYLSFEFFQNLANPIYLDPQFDYRGFMKLCCPAFCREPQEQMKLLEAHFDPRTALHTYRVLMVPIHFLEKKKFELNVFKLNKRYKFKMLPILKKLYLNEIKGKREKLKKEEKRDIKKDIKSLLEKFRELKATLPQEIDQRKIEKWKTKAMKIYPKK